MSEDAASAKSHRCLGGQPTFANLINFSSLNLAYSKCVQNLSSSILTDGTILVFVVALTLSSTSLLPFAVGSTVPVMQYHRLHCHPMIRMVTVIVVVTVVNILIPTVPTLYRTYLCRCRPMTSSQLYKKNGGAYGKVPTGTVPKLFPFWSRPSHRYSSIVDPRNLILIRIPYPLFILKESGSFWI